MFPVREHLALAREVRAAAIDEINARKIILPRNLLRAQMLLDGERIISAAFHGRVIGNDDAFLAADPSNTADQSGRREIILINLITRKLRELQKGCTRIEQRGDALARQHFPRAMYLARAFSPPPLAMVANFARMSATSDSIADSLALNFSLRASAADLKIVIELIAAEQLSADQHAPNLARPCADLIELRV